MDQFDSESDALQADVMRFMAIIAFSLLVIFIPLIQSLNENVVQEEQRTEVVLEDTIQEKPKQEPISKPVKPQEKDAVQQAEKDEPLEDAQQPRSPEKTFAKSTSAEKGKKLRFAEGAFLELLKRGKIKGYVIIVDHQLCFEITYNNGEYRFRKASVGSPEGLVGLKQDTLPLSLINNFKKKLPSLASYKYVYCFDPSPSLRISRQLNEIIAGETYGIFTIQSSGKIAHED